MDWHKDPSHGEVTTAELPLELSEKISRYAALKTYTDFKMGTGIGLSLYMSDTAYQRIVNENFDEVTVGYEMKHGAMVKSTGAIDFTKVDAFMAKTKEAGLSVYGHTLVWHSNQNASYLNGLIAPTVIPGYTGTNLLSNGDFETGATGWGSWGGGKVSAGATTDVKLAGTNSFKVVSSAASKNEWDIQVQAPAVAIIPGHNYEIAFWIKSDGDGKVRLSFGDANQMSSQYPYLKADGSLASTSSAWKRVVYSTATTSAAFTAVGSSMSFRIDMGKVADMTYYIDNVTVVDLDATPVNLITNGDFETGALTSWGGWGNSSTRAVSAAGDGYNASGYAMVLTNPTAAQSYSAQQVFTFNTPLELGKSYTCTFMVKASTDAALQVEIQGANYNADYYGGITVGTTWTQVTKTITPSKADRTKFIFDFGASAATFYIDNIVLSSGIPSSSTITIDKTDAEKKTIVTNAMTDWISKMMGHYKSGVVAWDVVNEPMKEDGTLRDGNVTPASDEFFWVKYMSKDYAVTAFNLARQYGNGASDKLFINDYNLESNLAKCDGLIEYVKYIESKGATVDGIGTQMHISISSDTLKIAQMFQKLAASGKLIKVSELDVRIGTNAPTAVQLAAQAAMYKYVLDQYMKYIPLAQRYGVTAWGISDNAKEHEYWIPNDGPNLWDANYKRKHAYKGFADGLAGKDVSKGFSGELIIK